jgi:hypothetical protein
MSTGDGDGSYGGNAFPDGLDAFAPATGAATGAITGAIGIDPAATPADECAKPSTFACQYTCVVDTSGSCSCACEVRPDTRPPPLPMHPPSPHCSIASLLFLYLQVAEPAMAIASTIVIVLVIGAGFCIFKVQFPHAVPFCYCSLLTQCWQRTRASGSQKPTRQASSGGAVRGPFDGYGPYGKTNAVPSSLPPTSKIMCVIGGAGGMSPQAGVAGI